ncbi:hypothetical protein Btru_008322 [Bulinus truncatus]|nr:hypothetical protein Btru_008322 [Bulinus truncatus]
MKKNLRLPQKGLFGWIASQYLIKRNRFLEENAVRLCNIQPDHQVLEIGFGPGIGLEAAYNVIKNGKGKLYGVETSLYMVELTSKRLNKALADKKMMLFHGSATNIPLNTDSVHRVFHCNSYYFWPSMRSVLREIYRVMKPGGVMVTTLCLENLKQSQKKGFLNSGTADPVKYMVCLENFGFENVHIEYHKDAVTGKEFQAIFSEVIEKPAHDNSLYSDDEDDEIEKEVERLFKTNSGDLVTNCSKNNTLKFSNIII